MIVRSEEFTLLEITRLQASCKRNRKETIVSLRKGMRAREKRNKGKQTNKKQQQQTNTESQALR